MKQNKLFLLLILSACLIGTQNTSLEANQHRTPGEKVDDAIDYTKDKFDEAKDKTKDTYDKVKDKTKEGIKDGIDKTKNGLDKLKDKLK